MDNRLIIGLAITVAVVLTFLWLNARGRVSSETAHRLVADGAVLLDVRSVEEFAGGHIDGAVNIPVHLLADRLTELPDQERAVVVYCQSGIRSRRAKGMLERSGYTSVHDLGGIGRW